MVSVKTELSLFGIRLLDLIAEGSGRGASAYWHTGTLHFGTLAPLGLRKRQSSEGILYSSSLCITLLQSEGVNNLMLTR